MIRPLLLALLLTPAAALAQDAQPNLPITYGGSLDTKVQGEFSAPNNAKSRAAVSSDADLQGYLNWSDWLSFNTDVKLERTRSDNLDAYFPDRNAAFRSETLTLRQLYATLRPTDGLEVYGGKIHPKFGSAYEDLPGLFYNYASDYEQDERIGLGIAYRFGDVGPLTNLRLSAETFYLDTSALSATLPRGPAIGDPLADRAWRYTRGQYGPSNTGSLSSFTLALRGGRKEQGVDWQASLTHEATADPAGAAEDGQSISASYDPTSHGIPLTRRIGVTPFLEYTHFTNFADIKELERHYVLAGAAFGYRDWELDATAGLRRSATPAVTGTDHQETLSLTYEVIDGFKLGAGVNHVTLNGRGSWVLAPAIAYHRDF